MDNEINLKHLILECFRNAKKIILLGLIIAVVMAAYGVMNIDNGVKYGSQGVLIVEDALEDDVSVENLDRLIIEDSLTETNKAMLTSDAVLNDVINDPELKDKDYTVKDIRSMIYFPSLDYSRAMDIQVVTNNEDVAQLVCSKILEYGVEYFNDNGCTARIEQKATFRGPVTVSVTTKDGETFTSVDVTAGPGTVASNAIKYFIFGVIIGIAAGIVAVSISFIFRNRIIYSEQIEDDCGINYLGTALDKNTYKNVYSDICTEKGTVDSVSLITLATIKGYGDFIDGFVATLKNAGKKVIVLEYVNMPLDETAGNNEGGIEYVRVNDEILMNVDVANDFIASLKDKCDILLLKLEDINENPMSRIMVRYADSNIVLIEKNTIKAKELYKLKTSLSENGMQITGALLVDNKERKK